MKKALIIRYGAYGDLLIITPVLRELKKQGYYILLNVSNKGALILKDNPNIDEFIFHEDNSVACDKLEEYWDKLKAEHKPDLFIDFCESIEVNLCLAPRDPQYNYSKEERREICDKNYYEETFKWANLEVTNCDYKPEIYFSPEEIEDAKQYIKPDHYNILWCLSGSNKHKAYPWTEQVMEKIIATNDKIHFITVGDESCQTIEPENTQTTKLSGKVNMRTSMCLTGLVDLVISPDTGVLHASGAFTTPKIGLLGHTTIENITKHFTNDYSIESTASCAPCFRLIYDVNAQCSIDLETGGVWCQATGIPIKTLTNQIQKVINKHARERLSDYNSYKMSDM